MKVEGFKKVGKKRVGVLSFVLKLFTYLFFVYNFWGDGKSKDRIKKVLSKWEMDYSRRMK